MNEVTPQPRVAILGTGKMGSAIAGRLSGAGFELTLWNRTRERAHALGIGQVAETPTAAARNADVIISSLTGPDAVRAAYLERTAAEPRRMRVVQSGRPLPEVRKDVEDIISTLC